MRRLVFCALILTMLLSVGLAEETARRIYQETDQSRMQEFAREYAPDVDVDQLAQGALDGELPGAQEILAWLKARITTPVLETLSRLRGLMAPLILLALIRSTMPRGGGSSGAGFLLRMVLMLGFSQLAVSAMSAGESCLKMAAQFADAVAPAFTALLAAMGMSGSAALVSPTAALAAGAAENLFLRFGLPLCRFALCMAIAGNLSTAIDLSRISRLLKKTANWGAGLAITLFTAFLAIQGNVAGVADGVTVRTAKYAVDSAAPVIGSGISDAWDSYVSGVLIAKNAVGVTGLATIFAAGLRPLVVCVAAMFLLNLVCALLEVMGEREAARAAEQIGGICQMVLSLCTGALAIDMILLGGAMAAGGSLWG